MALPVRLKLPGVIYFFYEKFAAAGVFLRRFCPPTRQFVVGLACKYRLREGGKLKKSRVYEFFLGPEIMTFVFNIYCKPG